MYFIYITNHIQYTLVLSGYTKLFGAQTLHILIYMMTPFNETNHSAYTCIAFQVNQIFLDFARKIYSERWDQFLNRWITEHPPGNTSSECPTIKIFHILGPCVESTLTCYWHMQIFIYLLQRCDRCSESGPPWKVGGLVTERHSN